MSTGFLDNGWVLPTGALNHNGVVTVTTGANANHIVPGTDIISYMKFCGVYVFSGAQGSVNNNAYEIFCSLPYTIKLIPGGIGFIQAILLYPGFGFIGYTDFNYTGSESRYYCNISNTPKLLSFYKQTGDLLCFPAATSISYINEFSNGSEEPNTFYFREKTMRSIKVFLLGSEITIKGLTSGNIA